ncbi:MAG: AmmeMemoRadiSam system protein A [Anaerolineae bacterium]
MSDVNPFVDLARKTVEQYVTTGTVPTPPDPLPEEMSGRAGVFVSIHSKDGSLRGCIGTFEPVMPNIAQEIIQNAVSASTHDPRFPRISPAELDGLEISVDVLSTPEPCYSLDELDPKQYGVIVHCGARRGLLLPDLEGVDTAQQQVSIAMRKAGIRPSEPVALQRFTVKRHC